MDLNDYELQELGLKTKALLDLLLKDPYKHDPERVVNELLDAYERIVCRKHG